MKTHKSQKANALEVALKKARVPFKAAFLSSKWSADKTDSRHLIRKKLFTLINNPAVLKFTTVSKCDDLYFSISHTAHAGALITASQPIGIDVEPTQRNISARVLNRLATPIEQTLDLTAIEIWVAKEAAFKAVNAHSGANAIRTISEINIRGIKKNISKKTFEFSIIQNKNKYLDVSGQGCIFTLKDTTMGIAWIKA